MGCWDAKFVLIVKIEAWENDGQKPAFG